MRDGSLIYYKRMYETVEILPERLDQVIREAKRILTGKEAYMTVQARTGVPWVFPACIHELEADCNFRLQILNGEPWDRKTRLVPKGLGPWASWADAAITALQQKRKDDPTWKPLDELSDWTVQQCLLQWERWNGGGYRKRDKHSPYLWAGSKHGADSGYYTSDGKYSATAQSKQIGCGVLLWYLKNQHRILEANI